jgi:hypothetical protein
MMTSSKPLAMKWSQIVITDHASRSCLMQNMKEVESRHPSRRARQISSGINGLEHVLVCFKIGKIKHASFAHQANCQLP